jgi:small subunit ribosomal protein S2
MASPKFTMRELMEAGVHFGHKTKRWNPKMAPFLFGIRNDLHIIDLNQTVPMLQRALQTVHDIVSQNGRVLFVGTKRQAQDIVAEQAKRCGQHYVNHRWLGGMLTNWKTIHNSIKRMREIEEKLEQEDLNITKNERLQMRRQYEKLEKALGGIRDMGGLPDVVFVLDSNKDDIAIKEANRLGIPVIAILDSNSDPDNITLPVPGNDDAARAIDLYCRLVSDAVLAGIENAMVRSGVDIGAKADPKATPVKKKEVAKEQDTAPEAKAKKQAEAKADEKEDAKVEEKPKADAKKATATKKAPAKKATATKKADAKTSDDAKKADAKKAAKA